MIGSAQSAHLVDSVILSRHTACLAPPNVAILRMYTSSESHFLLPAKRLALRMHKVGQGRQRGKQVLAGHWCPEHLSRCQPWDSRPMKHLQGKL